MEDHFKKPLVLDDEHNHKVGVSLSKFKSVCKCESVCKSVCESESVCKYESVCVSLCVCESVCKFESDGYI